jgi:dihydroxyacetone kinase-like protein
MCDLITVDLLRQMILDWADTMEANADYLTQLDIPIGDGDHGRNMALGFQTVREQIGTEALNTPGALLRFTGMTLVATVGGASGPLYAAALIAAGIAARSTAALTITDLAQMTRAAADSLAHRGRCGVSLPYFLVPIIGPIAGGIAGALVYDFGINRFLVAKGEPEADVTVRGEAVIDKHRIQTTV